MHANRYSRRWFTTFLGRIDDAIVAREVAFLRRQIPAASRVLDLCCGPGRHAQPLESAGYRVVGLDIDAVALRDAAARAPNAAVVRGDMCSLPLADASVDAVICMWQSFGHFDDEGNQHVLHEMARVLTRSGRLILDLYHRDFHAARLGERILERDGLRVRESRAMRGPRLSVRLQYEPGNSEDQFEWDLYTPEELAHRARPLGLELRLACAEFDEHTPASADHPRMQLVFQGSPKRQKASPVSASAIRRA